MGVMPTITPYRSELNKLMSDDILIMFTDGITEAMDEENSEYSDEKLEELAISLKSMSANEILQKILTDVRKFTHGIEQSDDITALVVKVN